ncbi:MAG: glycoside hydrolase family 127 protein, partial [Muribaculaceae bacterium]|nr:glycoside hydrolase family 127 protein [Muribaculaceae bacterium]
IAGHYLSALAMHYAATSDQELLDRLTYMLDEMEAVQKANGDGYVGGVPQSKQCWDDLRACDVSAISKRWVPWYNMHKVYAGLRDAYIYAGSQKALDMFIVLCDWGLGAIANLDDDQMERMVASEFGGMNEVFADAYDLTGDERYLDAAIRFSHHWLLDSMAAGIDNLDNNHANTQVPKAVGYQRVAEMCAKAGRDDLARTYADAADFFWHTVADTRSLAIGGNSRREYFPSASDCVSYTEEREGPESCNTNNMLKLTEGLYRMHPESHYADFYERAMFNHILSTQHPDHGGYVYFTSARPGHYRVYSQPNSAMWCCVGTGMENHGKYGQFIYSHDGDDVLVVNLFVPSTLSWGDISLTQHTGFPDVPSSKITVSTPSPREFTMRVRKPWWCDDFAMKINGSDIHSYAPVDGYIEITRTWADGDVVDLSLPMTVSLEEMPNVPEYVAIMRGPIVLGASVSKEDLDGLVADNSRWGHIASGRLLPTSEMPAMIGSRDDIVAKLNDMKRLPGDKPRYKVEGLFSDEFADLVLEPFANIHDSRYMMY